MKHVFTFFAFVLMSSGFAQESEVPPNPNSSQTAAGVFGGDDHIWLTDAEFLNFGQSSFTAHVRFRSTDLSNLNECCGYQTLIAKGASGGSSNKGFNLDLRGEPDNARINCNFVSSAGNNLYLVAPIEENVWYDLVYVVDWSSELATLYVNGAVVDEGSIAGLGSMDNNWYATIGRYVWDNNDGNDAHFLRGEMSWLRMIEGADYELGSDPCAERENLLFELDEFTAEEVAAQVNSVFSLDEVASIESQCETIVQVLGCTDPAACNFMPAATLDDGSCIACSVFEERCGQGTLWDEDSQTCIVANPSDTDFDGCVSMTDLLDLLTVFGTCADQPFDDTNELPAVEDALYVMDNSIFNQAQEFTIAARAAFNGAESSSIIYQQIEGGEMKLSHYDGVLNFQVKASNGNCYTASGWVYAQTALADEDLHHIVATYDRTEGEISLSIDGEVRVIQPVNGGDLADCDHYEAAIGNESVQDWRLAEIGFYQFAWTADQIEAYSACVDLVDLDFNAPTVLLPIGTSPDGAAEVLESYEPLQILGSPGVVTCE